MRKGLFALPLVLLLSTSHCAVLEKLPAGVCGNGVIDRGEDCDGLANGASACRGPEDVAPCRLSCDDDGGCPPGFGCGADDVCRRPTGTFESTAFVQEPSQALELMSGYFDSDRREDILAVEPGRARIFFVGAAGDVQQTIIGSPSRPSVGKLGPLNTVQAAAPEEGEATVFEPGDTTDDVVLALGSGLGAMLSEGDGTFEAKTFLSFGFGKVEVNGPGGGTATITEAMPFAIDALPATGGDNNSGDETAALVALRVDGQEEAYPYGLLFDFGELGSGLVFGIPGVYPSSLAGPPVTANFDKDDCQELVFPVRGKSFVRVYKTCKHDPVKNKYEWLRLLLDTDATVVDVGLNGQVQGPVFARDVNKDGFMDLVVTTFENGYQLQVAYGLGDGTFQSWAPGAANTPGYVNQAGLYALLPSGAPLDVGRLNNDEFLDVVDAKGVLLGAKGDFVPVKLQTAYEASRVWTEAVIADLNANGIPDVVACGNNAADLDVLNGTGGPLFNPSTIATDGTVRQVTIGDFDGDLVNDVAFSDVLASDQSLLAVAFGRTSGGPEEMLEVGSFSSIKQIVRGNVHTFGVDGITDMGVVSTASNGELAFSFMPGSGDRQMLTPYLLSDEANRANVPLATATGLLRSWDPEVEEVHRDLAVLAIDVAAQQQPKEATARAKLEAYSNAFRLWALYGSGDGDLASPVSPPETCWMQGVIVYPGLEQASSMAFSEGPLGQKGELFLTSPFVKVGDGVSDQEVSSVLLRVAFDEKGQCYATDALPAAPGEVFVHLRAVDLNGNGIPEVLAVKRELDAKCLGELLYAYFDPKGTAEICADPVTGAVIDPFTPKTSQLYVFWDGDLASGGEPVMAGVDGEELSRVTDFAVGHLDADPSIDLLVADRKLGLYRFSAERDSQVLNGGERLPLDLAGADAVLLVDADGDGVKDLAVKSSALQIYRGVAEWSEEDLALSAQ
ncbi:MAG: VCBS repeat-containing protein [Polyangiaceae bacterium]